MKLYVTHTSPFARMVHMVIIEKGLTERVEIIEAQTRTVDSPYYAINPSGRVPYLIRDDGVGLEESQLIIRYLDHLDGQPVLDHPDGDAGWESRRLEALARSLIDGLSVWGRELHRPKDERGPTTLAHERARSRRMAAAWELEIEHPLMTGALNMAQVTLISALLLEQRNTQIDWRTGHPKLTAWADAMATRDSVVASTPPR